MKYRRIVAGLLAINLVVGSIWTGENEVSAENNTITVSEQSTENTQKFATTENSETDRTDAVDENENTGTAGSDISSDDEKTGQDSSETKDGETGEEETNTDEPENTEDAQENPDAAEEDAAEEVQVRTADISPEQLTFYDSSSRTATVASPQQLILLSHCDQRLIQDITIDLTTTGTFDLSAPIAQGTELSSWLKDGGTAGQDYTYLGLGSEDVPFKGKITGQTPSIKANTSIFGGLSSTAIVEKALSVEWSGDGIDPMLAKVYVFEDTEKHEIPLAFTSGNGSIAGTVKGADGTLKIANKVTYRSEVTAGDASGSENAGLICNTLENGNIVLDGYIFPEKTTVQTGSGEAGGIVGKIVNGTLTIQNTTSKITGLTVKSASGYAGSVAGNLSENAQVVTAMNLEVSSPDIKGKYAGGYAGAIQNTVFSGEGKITVTTPTVGSETNTDANVGGLAGYYMVKPTAEGGEQTLPKQIDITGPKVTTNGGFTTSGGYAGGYFGVLDMRGGKITYRISGTEDAYKEITTTYTKGTGAAYGAVTGKVKTDTKSSSLILSNLRTYSVNEKNTYYQGGLIGELEADVYAEISNADATISDASYSDNNDMCRFGGLVGHLSENSILSVADSVKVTVTSNAITSGGGIVGNASSGSILEMSGTTDLSGVNYSASQYVGQLVGGQDCALIFAHGDGNGSGWKFIRSNFSSGSAYVNDIGNYGEILRLKAKDASKDAKGLDSGLFEINADTHTLEYGDTLSLSDSTVTIESLEQFALLSVVWNSHGVFSPTTALTRENWTTLKSTNISIEEDIDLENTGILGISRDSEALMEGDYTGKVSGNDHTITLSVGETFGYRGETPAADDTEGCGKIYAVNFTIGKVNYYYHRYQGLFASAQETIENLKIAGKIKVSNAIGDVSIGSIAGKKVGGSGKELKTVTVTTTITLDACGDWKTSYVGGLYGESAGGDINFTESVRAEADIVIKNSKTNNDVRTFVGSVLGYTTGGKVICNGLQVAGSITTDAPNYAYVGGVLGFINPSNVEPNTWIEIRNLVFDGFSINAPNASVACGGLLGGIWSHAGIYFMGKEDGDDTINGQNVTKMTVQDATIDAPNASVGGLLYKASGILEIRTDGIDIQKMKIHAGKDLGLLVCHGEKSTVKRGWDVEDGALYLRTTQDWKNAYKIAADLDLQCGADGVFDELVAYTAASKESLTNNGENGIISLRTEKGTGVAEENSNCTTYQNRTTYGKTHRVNACSRYYYDLDQYVQTAANAPATRQDDKIDTPEELLLWSCTQYACQNIKKYFYGYDVKNNRYNVADIQNSVTTFSGTLNMKGYSYYPIELTTGITMNAATITFYNQEIEGAETAANNKSTKKTSGTWTQHYMMHCGLFLNHMVSTKTPAATSVVLDNVTFAGSIGKIDDGVSGALFSGTVQGADVQGKQYTVKMKLKDVTLSGLKITDYAVKEVAPLLINHIGSYTKTEVNGVKTNTYTPGTAVASSLFGNAGSENGHQINMSFSNMTLPDKKAGGTEGIFTHATFLESYKYADDDTSVATYNFYKKGDWPEEGVYNHQVTYGREISETKEYPTLQKWYYDKKTHNTPEGEVVTGENEKKFSDWLPYVYVPYDQTAHAHEIKVNQRVYDITVGCGTYGDPYVITDAGEMEIIAEYMTTNMPRTDWKVTITGDQKTYCTATGHETDISFRYDGEQWIQIKNQATDGTTEDWVDVDEDKRQTRSSDFMQRYMANAYYDIRGTKITLKDFKGFGTADNPFRGVITSSTGVELDLEGANTGNGLIAYSYGSVVRNLTVKYQGEKKTLTYQKASSEFYPGNCFGGVIGCILGGDNIIDKVSVTLDEQWLTLSGGNKRLLQVGGYVGSVSGGGVRFKNMSGNRGLTTDMISGGSPSGEEESYSSLYVNPYVGRVLDGYAFAVTAGDKLENTEKNYQIQNIAAKENEDAACLKASGESITIADQKGLLILSAIVNSGAASAGSSNAYRNTVEEWEAYSQYAFGNGKYGKVRNAEYEKIGAETQPGDFAISVKDDRTEPNGSENTPYLITTYGGGSAGIFNIAVLSGNTNGTELIFPSNGKFNMAQYGSSYQGIAARYVANAVASDTGTKAEGVVPLIQKITGNGTEIVLDMQVKEYADDDFHAASVGGLLNLFSPSKNSDGVSNLTLAGKSEDTGVILQYYTAEGQKTETASLSWAYKSNVGVGSFAGSSSGAHASAGWYKPIVNYSKVRFENMTVKSPASAGGLIGNLGRLAPITRTNNANVENVGILLQPYGDKTGNGQQNTYVSGKFENCSYEKIRVNSEEAAGGFCGYVEGYVDIQNNLNVTDSKVVVGTDSNITANAVDSCAGGLYGYVKRGVAVNKTTGVVYPAKWTNVHVSAGKYAGGLVGRSYANYINNKYSINEAQVLNSTVTGTSTSDIYAGGIIGAIESNGVSVFEISGCNVENTTINTGILGSARRQNVRAGGIIGRDSGITRLDIKNCEIDTTSIYGSLSGGIIGDANTATTITGCTVSGGTQNSVIQGRKCAAGAVGNVTRGVKVAIHESNISRMHITCTDDWGAGGLVGDIEWNSVPSLYFFDSKVESCQISGQRAGGLAGNIRGNLNGSNILLKDTTVTATYKNNAGLLIGLTGNQNLRPMSIAGVSIQNTTATENGKSVTKLYGTLNDTDAANVKKQSYFSFADYEGTASESEENLLDETKVSPYVVTSPVSSLKVFSSAQAGDEKFLYGDGAAWDKTFKVNAEKIFNQENPEGGNPYKYADTGVSDFSFKKNMSTYNDNNQPEKAIDDNFPVLVLSGHVSDTVTAYLNILTNGGYTRANTIQDTTAASPHVDASVSTYIYDESKQRFVPDTTAKNSIEIKKDSEGRISEFATTAEYDNTRSRFTLLTVTFTEKDENSEAHTCKIQIPIIVKRVLEIDFTATLSAGTNYRASNYEAIEDNAHLLESTGNAFTAYLTYTYNSADGIYSDYGWNSYVNAGGNVAEDISKVIRFDSSVFPVGTQLSLVDKDNGDKVYYYTVSKDTETDNGTKVSMEDFADAWGNKYQPKSAGELMGVTATKSENGDGSFIEVTKDGKPVEGAEEGKTYNAPTVRIKSENDYKYYRLKQSGETGTTYTVAVDENTLTNLSNSSTVSESYYLVITVADGLAEKQTLNGSVQTEMPVSVPHEIHYLTRKGKVKDGHSNTASTYQISQGYQQELTENVTEAVKKISTDDSEMTVDVTDKITIPSEQAFQEQDALYLRFNGGMIKTMAVKDGNPETSAELFPDGTGGTAEFYVYRMNGEEKEYYTYSDGTWKSIGKEEKKAAGYPWSASNGQMTLLLSTDGAIANAINLQGIRTIVRDAKQQEFYVRVKLKAKLPLKGLEVIPQGTLSGSTLDNYVKLNYTSQLATTPRSLSYSTTRALLQEAHTKTQYYRDEPIGVTLKYEARQVGQLGINLLDLQRPYMDAAEENTLIDTSAEYDISTIKNLDKILGKSDGIRFRLQLQSKKTTTGSEESYDEVLELAPYMKVEVQSENSGNAELSSDKKSYVWKVSKEAYWDLEKNEMKTSSIFNGEKITQLIQLKVDVKNVQELKHLYANYKVVLTAEILNKDGTVMDNTNASNNIIYTLAKINPVFEKLE